jgi:hypothetical protein
MDLEGARIWHDEIFEKIIKNGGIVTLHIKRQMGKSHMIFRLAKYYSDNGKNVRIITPGKRSGIKYNEYNTRETKIDVCLADDANFISEKIEDAPIMIFTTSDSSYVKGMCFEMPKMKTYAEIGIDTYEKAKIYCMERQQDLFY